MYVEKKKKVKNIRNSLVRDPIRWSTLASSISQAITFHPVTTTERTASPCGGKKPASTTGQAVLFNYQTPLRSD